MKNYPLIRLSSYCFNKGFYRKASFEGSGIQQLLIFYGTLDGYRVKEPDTIFSLTRKKNLHLVELEVTDIIEDKTNKYYLPRTSTIDEFMNSDRKHSSDILKVWSKLDCQPLNEPFFSWFSSLYHKDYQFLMPYLEASLPRRN